MKVARLLMAIATSLVAGAVTCRLSPRGEWHRGSLGHRTCHVHARTYFHLEPFSRLVPSCISTRDSPQRARRCAHRQAFQYDLATLGG